MKYIRTRTNIFEVVEETEIVYKVIGASRNRNNVYSKSKCQTEVINSGDTIEELIDKYVIYLPSKNIYDVSGVNYLKRLEFDFGEVCYGAIWTEWGLKYVAKMNEKGELELI